MFTDGITGKKYSDHDRPDCGSGTQNPEPLGPIMKYILNKCGQHRDRTAKQYCKHIQSLCTENGLMAKDKTHPLTDTGKYR